MADMSRRDALKLMVTSALSALSGGGVAVQGVKPTNMQGFANYSTARFLADRLRLTTQNALGVENARNTLQIAHRWITKLFVERETGFATECIGFLNTELSEYRELFAQYVHDRAALYQELKAAGSKVTLLDVDAIIDMKAHITGSVTHEMFFEYLLGNANAGKEELYSQLRRIMGDDGANKLIDESRASLPREEQDYLRQAEEVENPVVTKFRELYVTDLEERDGLAPSLRGR